MSTKGTEHRFEQRNTNKVLLYCRTLKHNYTMKATDLRIGNYYLDICGLKNRWKASSFEHYRSVGVPLSRLKPIPLTEERLFEFGFEGVGFPYSKEFNEWVTVTIEDDFSLVIYSQVGRCIPSRIYNEVHQLQNLIHALTGEELKFER